jgi:hypothetical protein
VLCCEDFARKLFEIKIKLARRASLIPPTRMFTDDSRLRGGRGVPLKKLSKFATQYSDALAKSALANIFSGGFPQA